MNRTGKTVPDEASLIAPSAVLVGFSSQEIGQLSSHTRFLLLNRIGSCGPWVTVSPSKLLVFFIYFQLQPKFLHQFLST